MNENDVFDKVPDDVIDIDKKDDMHDVVYDGVKDRIKATANKYRLGKLSAILGLISIPTCIFPHLSALLAIGSILLWLVVTRSGATGDGKARLGLVCSVLGLILGIVFSVLYSIIFGFFRFLFG